MNFIPRPLRVLVYTLIPSDREDIPIRRGPLAFVRNRIRRGLELARWRLGRVWNAHYSTFEDAQNTNRGDIAIRMGVKAELERAFAGQPVQFIEVPWGGLSTALAREANLDLIVIAGGGYLFADDQGRLPARFHADAEALKSVTCPVVATSIGLNNLMKAPGGRAIGLNDSERPALRDFLSRLTLASVRDQVTQQALLAAAGQCLPVIVDAGFLLADHMPARGADAPAPNKQLTVGLNIAFHGAELTATNRNTFAMLARVLRQFQSETSCRYLYFVHSSAERAIATALQLAGVPCTVIDSDVATLLAAYRQLDVHVGQMLHSAILAMSVGVPVLALAYDVKSPAFFDLFGLQRYCRDMRTLSEDDLFTAICAVTANRREIAATIMAKRSVLRCEADAFYADIAALTAPAISTAEISGARA